MLYHSLFCYPNGLLAVLLILGKRHSCYISQCYRVCLPAKIPADPLYTFTYNCNVLRMADQCSLLKLLSYRMHTEVSVKIKDLCGGQVTLEILKTNVHSIKSMLPMSMSKNIHFHKEIVEQNALSPMKHDTCTLWSHP